MLLSRVSAPYVLVTRDVFHLTWLTQHITWLTQNECMFCDYLQGPSVTKTKMSKLDASLPKEVVFEDWFLRLI